MNDYGNKTGENKTHCIELVHMVVANVAKFTPSIEN